MYSLTVHSFLSVCDQVDTQASHFSHSLQLNNVLDLQLPATTEFYFRSNCASSSFSVYTHVHVHDHVI